MNKKLFERIMELSGQGINSVEDIRDKWKGRVKTLFINEEGNTISLYSIIINKEDQGNGLGSQVLEDIINYADRAGKRIILSVGQPNDKHGTTSRGRLVKFYKRFGFIENKGRNKDFSITAGMYREPR